VVADHGRGVPDALVPTLFSTLTPPARGADTAASGLGLFLVKGLVEGMGGRVGYETQPGGGASFLVFLPAAP